MRGDDRKQDDMFSYISPEQRIPQDHPLRGIRKMVDETSPASRDRCRLIPYPIG